MDVQAPQDAKINSTFAVVVLIDKYFSIKHILELCIYFGPKMVLHMNKTFMPKAVFHLCSRGLDRGWCYNDVLPHFEQQLTNRLWDHIVKIQMHLL